MKEIGRVGIDRDPTKEWCLFHQTSHAGLEKYDRNLIVFWRKIEDDWNFWSLLLYSSLWSCEIIILTSSKVISFGVCSSFLFIMHARETPSSKEDDILRSQNSFRLSFSVPTPTLLAAPKNNWPNVLSWTILIHPEVANQGCEMARNLKNIFPSKLRLNKNIIYLH